MNDDQRAKKMIRGFLEKLAALGSTPGEIAAALERLGMRGDYTSCGSPIAAYLRELGAPQAYAFPHYRDDEGRPRPGLGELQGRDEGKTWPFELPKPIDEFLERFNLGAFPELYKRVALP